MTDFTKTMLKAALVTGVIGAGFCIAGLCLGFTLGDFSAAVEAGKFQLIGPDEVQSTVTEVLYNTTEESIPMYEQKFSGEIEELDLDLGILSQCVIHVYAGDEIQVTGSVLPAGFECRMDGDTLKIDCENRGLNFWKNTEESYLEISIPEDCRLDKVDIDSGVSNIWTEGAFLRCRELDLDCGVGDCTLYLEVEEKAGIDGGVGTIDLILEGKRQEYDFDVDSGVGEIWIGEWNVGGLGTSHKIDNGTGREIVIDSGVGNVMIQFTE